MPQYFVNPGLLRLGEFAIEGGEARHILSAMRCRPGDRIELFDGEGSRFAAVIKSCGRNEVFVARGEQLEAREPAVRITLCFAPLSREASEDIVDKCTQLGVREFAPVLTRNSAGAAQCKAERWSKIALAACKQCGLARFPRFSEPLTFADALKLPGPALIAWESERKTPISMALAKLRPLERLRIFIGPEGGFDEDEIAAAVRAGAEPVSLGVNILRAETACAAACAIALQG